MTFLVAVDGVLRDDRGNPLPDMKVLVVSLIANARVVFVAPEDSDVEIFLRRERITGYASVEYGDFLSILSEERSQGYVQAIMTPDTHVIRQAFKQGVTGMLVTASAFVNPMWRPERRSWGEIEEHYENRLAGG